ncbi:MAG: wax ester/triacylglycerol synthase family O-acyltransferase [Desulfobacterales bacterium CG23_combo_of_CG06-09_8_20_14_all_51_8]|nr:MAG: wax ester/triacylglycerol synthase family O-acyltransferase [Desulfobacterales bacterium CG23_combo_of_CG06-09_8_20_14_all_51_8]
MSSIDNFWLHMDHPTNLMVITGFLQFDEPLDFKRLVETLKNRLLCYERFKKRVVRPMSGVGNACWELDPKFDIRSHLHRIALPSPVNKETLQELISDLTATPLDPTKPLWQAHYIENFEGNGSVLFIRIHHCIGDGISLIRVLLSTADLQPESAWKASVSESKGEKEASLLFGPFEKTFKKLTRAKRRAAKLGGFISKEIESTIAHPSHIVDRARLVGKYAVDAMAVISKILLLPADRKTVFKGELGIRKSVAFSDPIPVPDIKSIGKYFKATINDILVSMVTGALRRYLQQSNNLVGDLDIRMAMPINIRPLDTEISLGNQFSLILVALPVHIDDPVLRIREVQRRISDLKEAPDAVVAYALLNALGVSSAKLAKTAATMFANKTTGVMSNVPGPQIPLYFSGKEIKNIMFWVPRIGGLGLGISIISYNGKVSLGIATDTGLVHDPKSILDNFVNEYRMLLGMYRAGQIEKDPLVINDRFKDTAEITRDETRGGSIQAIRCKAITRNGAQCHNRAATDSLYCTLHQTKYESFADLNVDAIAETAKSKKDKEASAG